MQALPSSLVMDLYEDKEVCPESRAGVWSVLTFAWLNPLLAQGYKRALELRDVWACDHGDRVETVHAIFAMHWSRELNSNSVRPAVHSSDLTPVIE